jgi:flagellar FliJ protein
MAGWDVLIRLYKFNVDEQRRVVANLEVEAANINQSLVNLEMELASETVLAHETPESAYAFPAYVTATKGRREDFEAEFIGKQQEIAAAQEIMREYFQELKKAEVAQEAMLAREKLKQDRREQQELDELSLALHERKQTLKEQ